MSSPPPKYIFVNGVMKINPAYGAGKASTTTVANPSQSLAILSTMDDVLQATSASSQPAPPGGPAAGPPMRLSDSTTSSLEIMQDPDYLSKFGRAEGRPALDGGALLDGMTAFFQKYEVPIGLVNKLLALTEYTLHFMIDDSGSMASNTDLRMKDATQYLRDRQTQGKRVTCPNSNEFATRWEEAEDRMHILADMLAFIPTGPIVLSCFNHKQVVRVERMGESPVEFSARLHNELSKLFSTFQGGGTPIYAVLKNSFDSVKVPTMHYLLTDGVPSDASIPTVQQLIKTRRNPQQNPLTLITCSDVDDDSEWMKEVEEAAPYTAEMDDFVSERTEVLHDQGPVFPYSKGFWLISHLVGALNPDDLDALDESVPLTKGTMDNLLGRKLSVQEYDQYFSQNPNSVQYRHLRDQFLREDLVARQIVRGK